MSLRIFIVTTLLPAILATIEVIHDGTDKGITTLRCLWTSGPNLHADPKELHGSWHQLCYGEHGENVLAVFSVTGLTSLHPSVKGESWGNLQTKRITITSVIRLQTQCHGIVVCAIGKEEDDVILLGPLHVEVITDSVIHGLDQGILLNCHPYRICEKYDITWIYDEKIIYSNSSCITDDKVVKFEEANMTSMAKWSMNMLWLNNSGPWSTSNNTCLTCEVHTCDITETATVCNIWAHDARRNFINLEVTSGFSCKRGTFTIICIILTGITWLILH